MSFVQLGRLMAVLALIGALLAMILVQQERAERSTVSRSMTTASAANPLRAELIHCKQLNAEAAAAASCDAAWARIRERFLGHGGAENGTVHNEVAAAPNVRGR
jgi:conjugative transfer region protein TrbK